MYRGGKICLTDHFKPLWARNVPKFGIAHAMALGVSILFVCVCVCVGNKFDSTESTHVCVTIWWPCRGVILSLLHFMPHVILWKLHSPVIVKTNVSFQWVYFYGYVSFNIIFIIHIPTYFQRVMCRMGDREVQLVGCILPVQKQCCTGSTCLLSAAGWICICLWGHHNVYWLNLIIWVLLVKYESMPR